MRAQKMILASAGAVAFLISGAVQASAFDEGNAGMGAMDDNGKCEVRIDRSREKDTFEVYRQELENGDCICYAYTGPKPQSQETEDAIAQLERDRECRDAPPLALTGPGAVGGKGFFGSALLPLLGLGGAGAVAAAAAGDEPPTTP